MIWWHDDDDDEDDDGDDDDDDNTWQNCPVTFSRNSEVCDLNSLWKVQRPTDINQQEFWKLLGLRSWAVSTSTSGAWMRSANEQENERKVDEV